MIDPVRRDSVLTMLGLSGLAALFVFAVYVPGRTAKQLVRNEITASENAIRRIPLRVAELEGLGSEIVRRSDYLKTTQQLVPHDADLHSVLRQVADWAKENSLAVTRMEPRPVFDHESYREVPFRISFSGEFADIIGFLNRLEQNPRLFTVEELSLSRDIEGPVGNTQADLYFSVYVRDVENSDFNEFRVSLAN